MDRFGCLAALYSATPSPPEQYEVALLPISLDEATLTPVLRQALGSPTARLAAWRYEPVAYTVINRITGGLYRLTGTATASTGTAPWSVFLKILQHAAPDAASTFNASDDETHWNYWRREALVYASDLLDDLPATLGAPRCYAITTPTPHTQWLWLEDIQGQAATAWPLPRFPLAARHLGHWQGQYAAKRGLPAAPWLSRRWLQAWTPSADTAALDLMRNPAAWRHPRLPAALKPAMAEAVLRLWDERTLLLDSIEQLPQTLCHLDFWPPNLFARGRDDGQEQTVLLDWSHVGLGAYAEDIANLALDSGWMFWVDHSALAEFEQLVWTG
jgi:hypothetical protein